MAVVVPIANLSSLSSHPINALSPVDPLSIIIPASLTADVDPFDNSINESEIFKFVVSIVVVDPCTNKLPTTCKSSLIVTVDTVLPILIGTFAFAVPIDIPFVVSVVSKSILVVPFTVNIPDGELVPIPTFPSTSKPFVGAAILTSPE